MIWWPVSLAGGDEYTIYFVDASQNPGQVYASPPGGVESSLFTRPSGNIYSFAFHPVKEKLFYCNANDNKIFNSFESCDDPSSWGPEQIIYNHTTYVRHVAIYNDTIRGPRLFFSEASGSGGDGKIFELISRDRAVLYRDVRLADVDGFWAGDFTFDDRGRLYLSSGNTVPASIYKVEDDGSIGRIFTDPAEPIRGLACKDNAIYYANWDKMIYRLDLSTLAKSEYRTLEGHQWISDVGFWDWTSSTCPGIRATDEPLSVTHIGLLTRAPNSS